MLTFYAIYHSLLEEVARYKLCSLKPLGSHTASDQTSKSAGDIEILDKNQKLIEVLEIKHGKPIDLQILLIAKDKIIKFNPRRYCIFSSANISQSDFKKVEQEIKDIKNSHGCQVIVNGVIPTLSYYLRLLNSPEKFVEQYSQLIEIDQELQSIHKLKWNEILSTIAEK